MSRTFNENQSNLPGQLRLDGNPAEADLACLSLSRAHILCAQIMIKPVRTTEYCT